jgi:hypothetical protein
MISKVLGSIAPAMVALLCLQATPAAAQSRVFVAAQGSDTNPCSFALPCRTFQHAHDALPAGGGEIDVLDPAGYGSVVISKAVSIQGHGFAGTTVASAGTGITVSAAASDSVHLNGLLIDGNGVGSTGIRFLGGKSLAVENCVVRNLANTGLAFSSSATTLQVLSVSNSYFIDNANGGASIQAVSSGPITAAIDRSVFANNVVGLNVSGTSGTGAINVAVTDSVAANNVSGGFSAGFFVQSAALHSVTRLALTRTTAVGNGVGLEAEGTNATLQLAQSTVTGNGGAYGIFTGAAIITYGDNYIDGTGTGTLTTGSKQ